MTLDKIRKANKLKKKSFEEDLVEYSYTDEEVEIARKESGYYDFVKPISDYNLEKIFLKNK